VISRRDSRAWRGRSLTLAAALAALAPAALGAAAPAAAGSMQTLSARSATRVLAPPRSARLADTVPAAGAQITADLSRRLEPGDPTVNRTPSPATEQACSGDPFGVSCELDALGDINSARAAEGVAPMVLPSNWNSLSVPQQLLVVGNLERVPRGLVPAGGLSASLNTVATVAAAANLDPNPSTFNGTVMAANWAGGYGSPLLVDFLWMYDDGLGSPNIDCNSATDPGCWGHRDNILYPFDPPVAMGAADLSTPFFGPSMTELFVGGDWATEAGAADALLSPTWAAIAQPLSLVLSTDHVQVPGGSGTAQLEVRSGGDPVVVSAAVTRGAGSWQVSASRCVARASAACELTVSTTGGGSGRLTLVGPAGRYSVALDSQGAARLRIGAGSYSVARGRATTVTGHLLGPGGAVAGQPVTLLARAGRARGFVAVAQGRTGTDGGVSFRVRPRTSTVYELSFAGSPALGAASAGPVRIRVRGR
jgi:hypothetical protein